MMKYLTIFGRGFNRYEHEKLVWRASICCFVMAFFALCIVFKSCLGPLPIMILEQSFGSSSGFKILMSKEEISEPRQSYINTENLKTIVSNLSNSRSDVYQMQGDIRIHGNSSTIFIASTKQDNNYSFTTKPYARKQDNAAMGNVGEFKIIHERPHALPHCTRYFDTPALVFSSGGYTGNIYHDFTDVLIPLYLTSRRFNTTMTLLITDTKSWWTSKYSLIFQKLSKHDPIEIDNGNDVLCFSTMVVGLNAHETFRVEPNEPPYCSASNFTMFLRSAYSLKRQLVIKGLHKRPRLLIVSREKNRRLMNEAQIVDMGRSMGFEVVVREMGRDVLKVAKFVNSFDVMMGVHGAGLTNMVFLPENAVAIQIVPFGVDLVAKHCFQFPAEDMKLRYLEYKVNLNESSLLGKYPMDSEFYRDPVSVQNKGWDDFSSVYLDSQDVNLDLGRFRETLFKALKLL